MNSLSFKGKTVWITGASSGIGASLARLLAGQGASLILSARRIDRLNELKKEFPVADILVQRLDLEDESSIHRAADQVLGNINSLDYMFHNGGISQRSYTDETSLEIDRRLMEVNYFGTIILTKRVLAFFLRQEFGHFVVTSSITGKFGFPMRSAYCASKHALHGYFESLRAEHVKNNILVTIACPGRIKTDISRHALDKDGMPTGKMDDAQRTGMSSEKCAHRMLKATINKKKEVYIGGKEIVMVYFKRFLPFIYYNLASTVKPD